MSDLPNKKRLFLCLLPRPVMYCYVESHFWFQRENIRFVMSSILVKKDRTINNLIPVSIASFFFSNKKKKNGRLQKSVDVYLVYINLSFSSDNTIVHFSLISVFRTRSSVLWLDSVSGRWLFYLFLTLELHLWTFYTRHESCIQRVL